MAKRTDLRLAVAAMVKSVNFEMRKMKLKKILPCLTLIERLYLGFIPMEFYWHEIKQLFRSMFFREVICLVTIAH